jgi:hypothetical protein
MGNFSDFLMARPSAIEGIARIFDFGNTLNEYNVSPSERLADEIALRMDWAAVGHYLKDAMREYGKEIKESKS